MQVVDICEHAKNCAQNDGTLHDNPFDWDTETSNFIQWREAYCEAKRKNRR